VGDGATMRAMRLRTQAPIDSDPLRVEELEVPRPAGDELLLRVAACAICRTDLHLIEGDLPLVRSPLVPGHQVVGAVMETGARCQRFRPGDRVGVAWLRRTCGRCSYCQRGRENLCARAEFTGYHVDGGYAEYALVPEPFAYALPPGFGDAEAAPLLCGGIIGYRALALSEIPDGGRLGLYGFGSSAHVTLQIARARGCEVYVFTRDARRRDLARALGATWTGDSGDAAPVKLDSAIIFAPAGELVPLALVSLDRGGTLALAGIHMTPLPPLDYEGHLFYERTIRSVTASTRRDGEALLAEAARIPLRPQITTFPLAEANVALTLLRRDRLQGSGVLMVGD
jgi:alcohol dehydrogenase, propanol-preferring